MNLKQFSIAILLSLLPCVLLAAEPIRIGVAGSFSGDLAPYGLPAKHAVQLAADDLNKAGGLLGRPVEVIAQDDGCKPETATNVAAKLIDQKVVAVIGHICSGATNAALSVYKDAQMPVISPSATLPSLTLEGKNPYFFRTIPHDAIQAILQADFIAKHLKAQTAVVIHDKGDYGKGLATLVKAELEARGVKVLLFEGVTPGAVDYSALIRKIAQAKPRVIAYGGYHPEASKIATQAKKKGITTPFVSGDGVKDPSFLKIGGKFVEGYYVTSPKDISSNPITLQVTLALKARGQEPGNFGLQAHAAFTALTAAIAAQKSTSPAAIQQGLQTQQVETTLGKISFDAHGDVQGSGFSVYQVRQGQFVGVEW